MQILSRQHDRFVVELTYEESALIGGSLHLYPSANELYHHPVPSGLLELANTFLWQGLIASLEARAERGWIERGMGWLWSRFTGEVHSDSDPIPARSTPATTAPSTTPAPQE
jgi:hypothetical protein